MDNLIPEARQRALGILKLYVANDDWRTEIATFLPDMDVQQHTRVLYRLDPLADLSQPPELPHHMRLQIIDSDLLQNLKTTRHRRPRARN